jgi:hypothetical protein
MAENGVNAAQGLMVTPGDAQKKPPGAEATRRLE